MDRRRAHVIVAYGVAALSLVVALTGSAYAAGQVAGAAAARQQLCIVTDKANGGQILDCDPYVGPTASPTSSPTATPAPSATTTPSPSSSPTPSPTTSGPRAFPTAATTGVPAGWTPIVTYTSGLTITSPG